MGPLGRCGPPGGGHGDSCSRRGACPAGCTPHFLFGLAEKKTGRARSKRKERFWSRSGTFVPPRCTGVGVRWCLRIYDDFITGAAECGTGLNADSRGGWCRRHRAARTHLTSSSFRAFRFATRSPGGRRKCCVALTYADTFIDHRPAAAKIGARCILDFPGPKVSPRAARFRP